MEANDFDAQTLQMWCKNKNELIKNYPKIKTKLKNVSYMPFIFELSDVSHLELLTKFFIDTSVRENDFADPFYQNLIRSMIFKLRSQSNQKQVFESFFAKLPRHIISECIKYGKFTVLDSLYHILLKDKSHRIAIEFLNKNPHFFASRMMNNDALIHSDKLIDMISSPFLIKTLASQLKPSLFIQLCFLHPEISPRIFKTTIASNILDGVSKTERFYAFSAMPLLLNAALCDNKSELSNLLSFPQESFRQYIYSSLFSIAKLPDIPNRLIPLILIAAKNNSIEILMKSPNFLNNIRLIALFVHHFPDSTDAAISLFLRSQSKLKEMIPYIKNIPYLSFALRKYVFVILQLYPNEEGLSLIRQINFTDQSAFSAISSLNSHIFQKKSITDDWKSTIFYCAQFGPISFRAASLIFVDNEDQFIDFCNYFSSILDLKFSHYFLDLCQDYYINGNLLKMSQILYLITIHYVKNKENIREIFYSFMQNIPILPTYSLDVIDILFQILCKIHPFHNVIERLLLNVENIPKVNVMHLIDIITYSQFDSDPQYLAFRLNLYISKCKSGFRIPYIFSSAPEDEKGHLMRINSEKHEYC